jgi:MHS family proline/betaine transporter-like MFS transporter
MKKNAYVMMLSSLGAGFEYYDFVIYGMLATYISPLFFPETKEILSVFKAFSIFAVGYFARPFGGIIFGLFADRYGRKVVFVSVMLLMALATSAIGFLPTTVEIGLGATISLVLLRLCQGLSFGAEIPGAITVVTEYQEGGETALPCGFVMSSATLGAVCASLVLMALTHWNSDQEILQGAWRYPFWLGGGLALVSFVIRFKIQETPAFRQLKRHSLDFFNPLKVLARGYKRRVVLGVASNLLPGILVISNIFFPSFLHISFGYELKEVYKAMTISLGCAACFVPLGSWLVDRLGSLRILKMAAFLFMGGGYFGFSLLPHHTFISLFVFLILLQVFISLGIAAALPLTAKLFPTEIRATGLGVCYNITYLMAALVPMILSAGLELFQSPLIVFYILAGVTGILYGLILMTSVKNTI